MNSSRSMNLRLLAAQMFAASALFRMSGRHAGPRPHRGRSDRTPTAGAFGAPGTEFFRRYSQTRYREWKRHRQPGRGQRWAFVESVNAGGGR